MRSLLAEKRRYVSAGADAGPASRRTWAVSTPSDRAATTRGVLSVRRPEGRL